LLLLLLLLFFPCAWGKSAVLDFVFFIKNARIYSLSLSLTFFRYSSRVERWRETAEREREGDGGATVYARELFLSLSLWCEISLSPLGFPYRRGEPETTRG
jgi:hypothetical protein